MVQQLAHPWQHPARWPWPWLSFYLLNFPGRRNRELRFGKALLGVGSSPRWLPLSSVIVTTCVLSAVLNAGEMRRRPSRLLDFDFILLQSCKIDLDLHYAIEGIVLNTVWITPISTYRLVLVPVDLDYLAVSTTTDINSALSQQCSRSRSTGTCVTSTSIFLDYYVQLETLSTSLSLSIPCDECIEEFLICSLNPWPLP